MEQLDKTTLADPKSCPNIGDRLRRQGSHAACAEKPAIISNGGQSVMPLKDRMLI